MTPAFSFFGKRAPVLARRALLPAVLVLLLLAPAPAPAETESSLVLTSSYSYSLGTFTGTVPFEWVPMVIDEARREVFVCDQAERSVRIFNEAGLEVYRFGDDERLGSMADIALLEGGEILLLSYPQYGGEAVLLRCDFRGEVQEEIALAGLPEALGTFHPDAMVLRRGKLYLADKSAMQVAAFDLRGKFLEQFDLPRLLGMGPDGAATAGLGGFDVDQDGALLFTVPVKFHAYRLRPGHDLEEFGEPGGAPGKFSVAGGIAAGPQGLIFVTDTLKSVVIVFDGEFNFLLEFGHRGRHPESLAAPRNLAVSQSGRLYVTQLAKRGVKVFRFEVKKKEKKEEK